MKKILLLMVFLCFTATTAIAADDAGWKAGDAPGWSANGWRPLHAQGESLSRQAFLEELADYKKISVYEAEKDWEDVQHVLSELFYNFNTVKVRGWGDWKAKMNEARYYTNPQSGKKILVPRNYTTSWAVSSALKDDINAFITNPPQ